MAGGECRVFERPAYEVRGRTTYDQDWIDGNVEAGVAACAWPRPHERPPELDRPAVRVVPTAMTVASKAVAATRPTLRKRIRARVRKILRRPDEPSTPAPPVAARAWQAIMSPPSPAASAPPAPPVRPPRSDLDELLDPQGGVP